VTPSCEDPRVQRLAEELLALRAALRQADRSLGELRDSLRRRLALYGDDAQAIAQAQARIAEALSAPRHRHL
jgi:hypothetical protein